MKVNIREKLEFESKSYIARFFQKKNQDTSVKNFKDKYRSVLGRPLETHSHPKELGV